MEQKYLIIGLGIAALYVILKKGGMNLPSIPGINGPDTMVIPSGNQIASRKGGMLLPGGSEDTLVL